LILEVDLKVSTKNIFSYARSNTGYAKVGFKYGVARVSVEKPGLYTAEKRSGTNIEAI
jgi:hypothetical protein